MSSEGATLLGSYSGASSTPTAAWFKWGTNSSSLNNTANATLSGESFSASISGLNPGSPYYYKAYVTVYGTGDYASQSQDFGGSVKNFTTKKVATATVENAAATNVTSSGATLNGSYSGASGTISDRGFRYRKVGTSSWTTVGLSSGSSPFSTTISGLEPSTQYEFQAYVTELDESQGTNGVYVDHWASGTLTFTTPAAPAQTGWQAYLSDYGMPKVSDLGLSLRQSGTNSDRDDKWYSVNTSNSNRQIAIHTYSQGAPNNAETLNYVVLYDQTKYAPVWTYHVMNTTNWPDNSVGRIESWTSDPAISLTQQTGLDNASAVGYSRGHLVASEYRQTTVKQNKQTFYYSNQAPQWQDGFNGSGTGTGEGVWQKLENRVRSLAPSGTTMMYVVTGVLYEGTTTTLPSNGKNVPIPSHFYKCIMRCTFSGGTVTGAQGIAFVYTNESHGSDSYYKASYVTSINNIETRAGFDFFAAVPVAYQDSAEANTDASWFTSGSNISSIGGNNWGSF